MCECGQKVHVYDFVQSNVIEYSRMFWNMHVLSHVRGDLGLFKTIYTHHITDFTTGAYIKLLMPFL